MKILKINISNEDSNNKNLDKNIHYPKYVNEFRKKISRTQLYINNDYEIVLIGWEPGAKSSIHNHANLGCIYFTILGELVEERFDTKTLDLIQIQNLLLNDVEYIDNDIAYHRIGNTTKKYSFSIHIYSPQILFVKMLKIIIKVIKIHSLWKTFLHILKNQ